MNSVPEKATHRVAVIAVHGVGHADPGGTVRHVADLLLGLGRSKLTETIEWGPAAPPYSGFQTQPIQVPLKRAPVSDAKRAMQHTSDVIAAAGKNNKPLNPISRWLLKAWHSLDERRGYIAEVFAGENYGFPAEKIQADLKKDPAKLAHEFMRGQLAGYVSEPEGKSYDTICLKTKRAPVGKEPAREVDLYEAYWADLARPQNSILSFLIAFYQLLFHFGSLSRTAVDYATAEHSDQWSWRWHAAAQGWAVRFLVLALPTFNLFLLLAGLVALPLKLGWNHNLLAASVLGIVTLVLTLAWPTRGDTATRSIGVWISLLTLTFAIGFGAGLLLTYGHSGGANSGRGDALLALEWWILGYALLYKFVFKPYQDVRQGAVGVSVAVFLASFAAFLYCLVQARGVPHPIEQASFWSMQLIMVGIIFSWLGLLTSVLFAAILRQFCLQTLPEEGAEQPQIARATRARARAALRTGRLTLAASASLFLVFTLFIWDGVFVFTNKKLKLQEHVQLSQARLPTATLRGGLAPADPSGKLKNTLPERLQQVALALKVTLPAAEVPEQLRFLEDKSGIPTEDTIPLIASLDNENRMYRLELLHQLNEKPERDYPTSVYANALMLITTTAGLPIILSVFGIVLVLLGWAVVPSLIGDPVGFDNLRSRRLGNWLSRGIDSTRAITLFLWHSIFTTAFVFGALDFIYSHGWFGDREWLSSHFPGLAHLLLLLIQALTQDSIHVLQIVGASLAVSGAVIAAYAYNKGRAVLDIVLDVDSYLRTSPLERAPRARIAERYTSLLRYIAQQKDPHDSEKPYYTSVVIAAHSLGALISADLLHYLRREDDPELASLGLCTSKPVGKTSISLFTFGNPLRQLMNRLFPHLYWWVREEPDNGAQPLGSAQGATKLDEMPKIQPDATPNPADLGLKRWVSAYRSGDFVGRSLWMDPWFNRTVGDDDKGRYDSAPIAIATDSGPVEETIPADATRVEACIGLGGHNDYWNRNAPDMAHLLDQIICS